MSASPTQLALLESDEEDPSFLSDQLITYIGNKRALLGPIARAIELIKARLGKSHLRILDPFSGSGVVTRLLKRHASRLIVGDIEAYARVISECYLANKSEVDLGAMTNAIEWLNAEVARPDAPEGFIRRLYSPEDDDNIRLGERAFYTAENARRIDAYRQLISTLPEPIQPFALGPLLSAASIHANTAGVFKGFYKDRWTGIGRFGGTGEDALQRIMAPIAISPPRLSRFECNYEVFQGDANELATRTSGLDVAYFDPPYNQHPYGSNYFMLNLLVDYQEPQQLSRVSGIPIDWIRSGYNVRAQSLPLLRQLLQTVDASFVLLSFNDEGFIAPSELLV